MAQMSFIIQQVQDWKFITFIQVLVHSKSKILRVSLLHVLVNQFKDVNVDILEMERCGHPCDA